MTLTPPGDLIAQLSPSLKGWFRNQHNPVKTSRISLRARLHTGQNVRLQFNPEEAATVGRRLLDWANRADPVAAIHAVGDVLDAGDTWMQGGQS